MNNSFAFHFTLFVASHLFSQLFWQAPSCLPSCSPPELADVCLCVLCPVKALLHSQLLPADPPGLSTLLLQLVLSGWKPALNPNPCYSLGRDEGVGSLRAQIFKFFQCIQMFKCLMCLDPNQHTTLAVLCQPRGTASLLTAKAKSCWVRGTPDITAGRRQAWLQGSFGRRDWGS